jgi:ribonuclease D
MTIRLHLDDLPDSFIPESSIAVDTEAMGLVHQRDRLCVVQISNGDGSADVVHRRLHAPEPKNLKRVLGDPKILKIFHFARFDVAAIERSLHVSPAPLYCTKIASKLARTYTDRHSLKDLTRELLGVDLSKQQQTSDWGVQELSEAQITYAASDVLYLHALKEKLDALLAREGRTDLAQACFHFLPTRARLDILGWTEGDIFAHSS